MRSLLHALPALLLLSLPAAAQAGDGDVALSWQHALAYVPGGSDPVPPSQVRVAWPHGVVIFLHGCAGIGAEERSWGTYLAGLGFIAVLPDCFARAERGGSCWPERNPAVHGMRRDELAYALEQVKESPWAQPGNIFVMGFSEGGDAVAESPLGPETVRGVVLASWTCRRFERLAPAPDLPMLSILWDDAHALFGMHFGGRDCADKFEGRPGLDRVRLSGKGHPTYDQPAARQAVADFLHDHRAVTPTAAARP